MVIVDDATEYFSFMDNSAGSRLPTRKGRLLIESLMGTRRVVVGVSVFEKNPAQVSGINDQDMIQALFSDGADPALSERVGIGSAIGRVDDLKAFGKEDSIENG